MKFNDPTPKYTTQPNGDVTLEWLPPTALMLTAHREMEKMSEIIQGQTRTMTSMQEHINYLSNLNQILEGKINDITAQQSINGSGTNPGGSDTTGTSTGESASA